MSKLGGIGAGLVIAYLRRRCSRMSFRPPPRGSARDTRQKATWRLWLWKVTLC